MSQSGRVALITGQNFVADGVVVRRLIYEE